MKLVLVLLLVVLVLLAGLPMAMGEAGMDWCPECVLTGGMMCVAMCVAILALFVMIAPAASSILRGRSWVLRLPLLATSPDKPPRLV